MSDIATKAMKLLHGLVQELDFDEAEGHPPSNAARELRSQAKGLLDQAEREGLIKLGPEHVS